MTSAACRASPGVVARRPVRDRDSHPPEELLTLILVEIHGECEPSSRLCEDPEGVIEEQRAVERRCAAQQARATQAHSACGCVARARDVADLQPQRILARPYEPVSAAAPQTASLDWAETIPGGRPGARVHGRALTIDRDGWEVTARDRERDGSTLRDPLRADPAGRTFGVMMFESGELEDLTNRSKTGDYPVLRPAQTVVPPLPAVLDPGEPGTERSPPRARFRPGSGCASSSAR